MTTRYEIPLTAENQTFKVALAGVNYGMTLRWNGQAAAWVLDIRDSLGNLLIGAIALITGTDLLAPYAYMNFGGTLTVASDNNADAIPTQSNLGSISHLYFTTP
jgi:hypothetical protein